jgi:hypothetical protein
MTYKRLLGLTMAMVVVAVLVGSVGAGAARTPAKPALNLSTNGKVSEYLRSLGISPRGVVIQRGVRNYAGPRCPGKSWTCTASHRVVQIARHMGKNRFRCTAARCMVVQVTKSLLAASTAKCVRTTGITQSCSITQNGTGPNTAIVYMNATKTSGLTQNASQVANVVQTATATSGGVFNRACVSQTSTINGSTVAKKGVPVTVTLDVHQSIAITQNSHVGGNTVENAKAAEGGSCAGGALTQSHVIGSNANGTSSITQNENTNGSGPNALLDIAQNQGLGFFGSASGTNTAPFSQTSTLVAGASGGTVTTPGPVHQTQGTETGGIQATVKQFSKDPSTIDPDQVEKQCARALTTGPLPASVDECLSAPKSVLPQGWTQVQFGPAYLWNSRGDRGSRGRAFHLLRKGGCCSSQGDDPASTFVVNQSSTQNSDNENPDTGDQELTQSNVIQGDCATAGNCTVTQDTFVNSATATSHSEASGQSVSSESNCSESTCTTSPPVSITPTGVSIPGTDVGEFGDGGMRGTGTGSISVSGVTGQVTHALLYWHGPTNSADPASNATVGFSGASVTGTNIGSASDNNWGFQNSQSYRADVTWLVGGNGTYPLSNFLKANADINGVALIVFFDDGNSSNDRTVVAWNGNDSNVPSAFDPDSAWDETIADVPYGGGSASLDLVVGDGQSFPDGDLVVNGTTVVPAGQIFDGDTGPNYSGNPPGVTGSLWDVKSFDITSLLQTGSNNLHLTSPANGDALSLVVAIANVPFSEPPVITGPALTAPQRLATAQKQRAAPVRTATPRAASADRGRIR